MRTVRGEIHMSGSLDQLPSELQELVKSAIDSLEPIEPEEAIEQFLEYKQQEIRTQTISEYDRKLDHFRQFCEKQGIDNLNDMTGRTVNDFRHYRRVESSSQNEPLSTKTMRDDMYLFRDFISFLEEIEAVPTDLSDKVRIPTLGKEDGVRNIDIDPERVNKILKYLERFKYASRAHVVWTFHVHTGRRPGGLYALDLNDLNLDQTNPYIELRHRSGETELKNGDAGETEIYISEEVAQIFEDYINKNRIDIVTDNGREPFLTTTHGRISKTTMRRYVYKFSRPCVVTGECPHDRDIESCDAADSDDAASKCPSSRPPYALRHGYITSKLRDGAPAEVIGDRCDVSEKVIEKHYDERNEQEKRELRQEVLEEIQDSENGGGYL